MAVPYIGSQISLISKSLIRYQGTLQSIDPNEHTVSLVNVSSFGSEGRLGQGKEIPPSSDTFQTIIFRGSDIKDLTVIQSNQQPKSPPRQPPSPQTSTRGQRGLRRRRPRYRQVRHGELHANQNEELKHQYQNDFDFESAKIEKVAESSQGKSYDKNLSFFDSLSSENSENQSRFSREKQKALDVETFGNESVEVAERDLRRYLGGGRRWGRRPRRNRRPRY